MQCEPETVAILDAGGQYAKVIDRKVRELKVKTEILPLATTARELRSKGVKAIIISGNLVASFLPDQQVDQKAFTTSLYNMTSLSLSLGSLC